MSAALSITAERLGCSERTLRRYVNEGVLRGRRLSGTGLELAPAEEEYLETHWQLLSALRAALRTEPAVRLAVLFGSAAVGDERDDSDVDLLVAHREATARAHVGLQLRLGDAAGRRVDVVGIEQAEAMPTLLADVLDEGRVLIDRDGLWVRLLARRSEVRLAAELEERTVAAGARAALEAARGRSAAAA